ncbi:HNH endonuclease [Natrialba hulunbeirensis JCM 10989]|uniref:HNH endonuclease n=1 Tax=Natrialba hulunbeirensis JCM 10989 TaxID=1227493 RepID=L9ZNT4_9EURY|nr:HNH endonuclease [Natrialba hulunbeirensis]ELY87731.1 HNH endonuclease [Natrialba hulunbeirensis JCM 10989]
MDCPTCGKSLSTEQGMRQHHTKVHSEPLPNRTCTGCETDFYDPKARRSYCDDCNPNAGSNNGNWRDAKETTTCTHCDADFSYYPSSKKGVFCPDCVADADGLLPENYAETVDRVTVACRACDAPLSVRPAARESQERGFFCTLECYGTWLSDNVVGPAHHQWEGGTITYGQKWWAVRRRALERDDYTCQHCGVDADELGRNPDVHHLERVRSFDEPAEAHRLENVVSLCRQCHRHAEEGTISAGPRDEK